MSSLTAHFAQPCSHETSLSTEQADAIIAQALALLEQRIFATGPKISGLKAVADYLRLQLIHEPSEVFAAVFLTTRHQVIAIETLFRGTIDSSEVHPRVVVQRAMAHNAAAVIVAHQHPSGHAQPSAADLILTKDLRCALQMLDVRLLDHFVIGKGTPFSLAKRGLL
ncbi:Mov34/MPN/PAD-1 family protein [Luteimonas sp. XNQY3]|nr:JAB domain-containing protein [Luteimonas sp. XNQY3]MCD9007481.1 Mov34/MPN/PAD-1 family protein [Luteimonas sp. XNQY3]